MYTNWRAAILQVLQNCFKNKSMYLILTVNQTKNNVAGRSPNPRAFGQLPTHTLITYRDQLDFMPSDQLRGNDHTYWETQHASHIEAWVQWRLCVRDGPALAVEVLSYPSDKYITWYRGITRVYIGNPANRDTRSVGYQPAGVDRRMMTSMLQEVDDMASVVIREPPSTPSQMAVFAKKVQTIIRRCMVSVGGPLGYTPSQHDIQQAFLV
ncbi:hypothetical protein M9H77_28028 [Catharanthus roseus]|uniref:Uncharacterized protein n=1 Tax=Catharanthus roseus TaxID=4058 RepID=A0ACC0AFV3_CATRO|nr:hypothetical protein M9H77_28028 [Catharanthus roseus]